MHPKTPPRRHRRRAAAVVELAICLPAIMLLVMGAIECCSMIFLRQALHVTAYEGIRVAIKQDMDTNDVLNRCDRILTERRIQNAVVTLNPPASEAVQRGKPIRIDVTAPCGSNSILPLQFFGGSNVRGSAIMIKE